MRNEIPTFERYKDSLGSLTPHVDPTLESHEGLAIRQAALSLSGLNEIDQVSLATWVSVNTNAVGVLGLTLGLSQEKLKNNLKRGLGTSSSRKLAREQPRDLVAFLDAEFALVATLEAQRSRTYDFGDVLVARAGARAFAVRAGRAGRKLEDEIEEIARTLGLPYRLRCRFEGKSGRTGPCDLALPIGDAGAQIVVAAKNFDSTGSKMTDAVREIEEMADVRRSSQSVFAVIDGIGWLSRESDLKKIYDLWARGDIDGMYTMASLGQFQEDLLDAARLRRMSPSSLT